MSVSVEAASLSDCDREPIRIPGSIQPHGMLFVVEPGSHRILQAAIGPGQSGSDGRDPVGATLPDFFPAAARAVERLDERVGDQGSTFLGRITVSDALYQVVAHRSGGAIVVEFEQAASNEPGSFDEVYPHVRSFLDRLQRAATVEELTALAAQEVRRITGLDRALVYRFDEGWNGEVIGEDRNDVLPSYQGLRFPASDIPAQARELYRLNRLRLIADANYRPVPIQPTMNPLDGQPIDLSFSILRSVSPVHLEYMRNMETMASMSISLLRDDRLWGLISCHSREPTRVPYHIRAACDFIGQVLSIQLASREATTMADRRVSLGSFRTRLLAHMAAADDYVDGLMAGATDLLSLTGASGAAIVVGDACRLIGETPQADRVHDIVEWIAGRSHEVFATDALGLEMPAGQACKDTASGVLAISISQIHNSYLLWFRPEVIRTVTWAGEPQKREEIDPAGLRLHPRKSFESWQETVRLQSKPWDPSEIEAATELRSAIVDIVLRNAEEMAAVSEKLAAINKELEAFSYSVSHDLRAPFRHIVGYAQLLKKYEGEKLSERAHRYVDTIVESAISAGTLVDDLLSFSQMGRATLTPVRVDMNELFAEVRRGLEIEGDRKVEWRVGDLPSAKADPVMLRLVIQNLLENALKFSSGRDQPVIEVTGEVGDAANSYSVRDNGTGFDMAYVGKLFGVFQRLHRVEDFEGTGIGLANVKRIVERHGGTVSADGKINAGATFTFTLPRERAE